MRRRKKVFVVLGAGSSVGIGMPSVQQIDDLMRGWAAHQMVFEGERYQANFFELAWDAINRHTVNRDTERQLAHDREGPNFEKALGLMIALSNWVKPRPHGQILRDYIGAEISLPGFFSECRLNEFSIDNFGASCAVATSYVLLLKQLAENIRERCRTIKENQPTEFEIYKTIFTMLRNRFDLGVLSLNYDNAGLQAWPDAFCGFSDKVDEDGFRSFDPTSVHSRNNWGFIYHLHGSVHHTLPDFASTRGVFQDRVRWNDNLFDHFVDGVPYGGSILDERSDGNDIPASTLIAGAAKLDQLLGDPFQSLYAALQRHVHEADAILVCGYGFGDMHVNRLLLSRMTRATGGPPPVMILEYTPDNQLTMFSRYDRWPRRMRMALAVGPQSFNLIPGSVAGVKWRRWFETAGDKVAVWHNGFLESAERLDPILNFLDGEEQALDGLRSRHTA